ncbi:Sphingomyelin phosphodiesterase 4, partial [Cinara cedri]
MQSSMYDYISPVFGNHENSSSHSFSTTESSVHNLLSPCGSLTEHIQTITNYINEADEKDLYNFFVDLVYQIFGHGPMTGWSLDKLKMKKLNDQFSYGESDSVYQFLCCNGYIFKLCYKLLPNSSIKFNIFFNDIPIGLRQKIENSIGHSYYGSRFLYPIDSNKPIGLGLNTFEYYMFHFALYGLKLTENDVSYLDDIKQESSVYKLLCLNYLQYFLPLENSASKILPKLPFNVLSTNTNQKQFTSPSSSLCFLKKELYCTDKSDKVECSWIVKSEATWRSELVAFFLVDIWLNYNIISLVPSIKLNVLIRCLIKHFHLYSNRAKQQPIDDLKSILIVRHGVSIYRYLSYYMINWPQDFSFRILLEIWLCYIQPWRYDGFNNQTFSITESEMSNKWRVFIMKNLLCYTKLFYLAIKRFNCVDICTPKYSIMIFRFLKIFTHPYLLRILLDIENLLTQKQYTEVDAIVADYLAEAEGPLYKYEPMFSENRISEYTLFVTKLHNTLDHINFKLNQFQKENMDSSSMVEKIFSLRNQKMSEYSVTQWEDLRTNIQSSLFYIKHIFNVNAVPLSMDLDSQSVSSFDSSHNVSGIIRKNNLLIQSFKR